ncbi:hypothetical protein M422DRAFT_257346 [Sphaerobolus stellatus SS14]|uniref:Cytochrome P450 n=1 Tax=Sphaerobolus stellatus (strain SS14) TaxID=990650 RepID=A0A0C9V2L9_SPHS4|nr:hypothetical protein M422DRAFT_261830 [Sphaerobolus stellatus SS14]KIJ39753.1 hypothetical protein M422DRAFT_257346 [Sphaerobolus stellatus SS14]
MFSIWIQVAFLVTLSVAFLVNSRRRIPRGLKLPPGPPKKFLVGNVFDMPKEREWETFGKWAKEYGEIVHVKLFSTDVIYVNSRRMAYELFEKRSSIYSDRTPFPMINDVMGWTWGMPFQKYGEYWRRLRRAMHEKFHHGMVDTFKPAQRKHARDLLRRLLSTPQDYPEHVRHVAGAVIMEITYGIHIKPENDPYLIVGEKATRALGEVHIPGTFLVDIFPWMKYIPHWMPGATFKRKGREWAKYISDMKELPFQTTKTAMVQGTADSCFVTSHLEDLELLKEVPADQEDIIKNTAGIVFTGGSDTIVKMTITFILAMLLYPEVQKKAQEELDHLLAGVRLVEFEDEPELPYISAICKEVLRWHPLIPQGVAHATSEDDILGEYFIPKGTIVVGNSWALLHDETDFGPDTDKFIPERYFSPGVRDPALTGAFGYGRRICPGSHMAQNSLFIQIALILQVFDISGPRDTTGRELPLEYSFTSGFFLFPNDFKCSIRPRSKSAQELILQSHAA